MKQLLHTAPSTAPAAARARQSSLTVRIAVSYSVFLLACLILGVVLYLSSTRNARENYWQQRMAQLENRVATMDGYVSAMDSYTRHLLNDTTFRRFTNMKSTDEYGYMYTAYEVMQDLSGSLFSLSSLPVAESHIYLKNVDYVISNSQFTPARQYYESYRSWDKELYDSWRDMLLSAEGEGSVVNTLGWTSGDVPYMFVRDIDAILSRSLPAVIWFELDSRRLGELLLGDNINDQALIMAVTSDGQEQFRLGTGDVDMALADQMPAAEYVGGYSALAGMQLLRAESGKNDWSYMLALPQSLSDTVLGNYDFLFILMLLLATVGGAALVALMVRRNTRPIRLMAAQINEAMRDKAILTADNESLAHALERQRPTVCASYMHRLLSGHIASNEEFDYMLHFLGLNGKLKLLVLYIAAYSYESDPQPYALSDEIIGEAIPVFLSTDHPAYVYATVSNSYIALVSYNEDTVDPLMDLQKRVLALHDFLLAEHSLWLYAGVGSMCTQASKLWEAYEQARAAARYATRKHIFLPYEVIRKDSDSVYFPIEISAKLLHFITTGNKPQVTELFALLHRENIEERTLPLNLLSFFLSDLKNTLLKARFSISEEAAAQNTQQLERIDQRLDRQLTFALCESTAMALCDFFRSVDIPSNPIPEIEKYLCDNFTDPSMCLTKLSERFQISESYLSHLFKEKTGKNFSIYLEDLRLTEAARRLKQDKDCSLQSLYLELGYNNATTFRRAFKKKFDITPSAMREG